MFISPRNVPLAEVVERACQAETNIFSIGIWTHHILAVVEYGRQLAELLGADADIVELAALLHDYASIKDATMYQDHHLHGPREAEALLWEHGYPPATIVAVKECIATHRGSVPAEQRTKEATCLASADGMAHIAQVPSLLYLAYVQHRMSIDEGSRWVLEKVKRSWQKLCPEAQTLIRERYRAALIALGEAL
jgi:uncharacterized protein